MAVTTPVYVRGILAHDPRFGPADIAATSSAGPKPDQPVNTDSSSRTSLILETSGDTDGTTRYVHVTQGGGATPGTAARWGWSTDGTSATQRGAFGRLICTEMQPVLFTSATYQSPIGLVMASGRLIVAYYNGTKIGTVFRDIDSTEVTAQALATFSAGGDVVTATSLPRAMWEDPETKRVYLLVSSTKTYGGTTYATLNLYYTDNEAATWTLGKTDVGVRIDTATAIDHTRAAWHAGYVTVAIRENGGGVGTWVSYDGGYSFVEAEALGAFAIDNSMDLVACDDGSVAMVGCDTVAPGLGFLRLWRKASPAAGFDGTAVTLDGGTGAVDWSSGLDLNLVACKAHDGTICALGRMDGDRAYRLIRFRQDASGASGVITEYAPGDVTQMEPIYTGSSATACLLLLGLYAWQDALWVLASDNGGAAVILLKLGGWSSVDWSTVPNFGRISPTVTVGGWVWCAPMDPASCGWTSTGAGSAAWTATTAAWALGTSANTRYYSRAGSTTGKPLLAKARVRVVSGGALGSDDIAIRLIRDTGAGSNRYSVSLRFSGTGLRLYDNVAAGAIGSDVAGLTSGDFLDVIISLTGAAVTVWYKAPTSTLWLPGPEGTATAAATAGANEVAWGNIASGSAASHWAYVMSAADDRTDHAPLDQQDTFPANGQELSHRPLWLQSGTYVRARSTPASAGEEFSVGTVYDYGYLDPVAHPEPGQVWRSAVATQVDITWAYDNTTAANVSTWSTSIGICLRSASFQTATLSGYDGSTYTTLASINLAFGMASMHATRSGYVLAPTAGTAGTRYLQADEMAGGYAYLTDAGTTYQLKLEGNRAGVFDATATGPQAILLIDRTRDLTGIPGSGTVSLVPPLFVAIAHGITTSAYRSFRLRIDTQATVTGYAYHTMRPALLGPLLVFGRQYELGRLVGPILTQRETVSRTGARRVQQVTRPRRYVEIAWTEAINGGGSGGVFGASPTPDAIAVDGSSTPVASRRDPAFLEGIRQILRGGQQPVVYLPSITTGSATSQIGSRELILPGYVVGDGGARTGVTGQGTRGEGVDEGSTIGTLRIEEMP